jgi:molybdenum cofactor cytidylyltransferase
MTEHRRDAPVSGIVLAAGSATRMGEPKQLLPLGDRCLLQHVVDEAARSCLHEIVVVVGAAAAAIRDAIRVPAGAALRIVTNAAHPCGQSTSLKAGLRAASVRSGAAAVLLADQPGVRAALIDHVVDAFRTGARAIARPVHRGADGSSLPGHPVVLARTLWADVERIEGDHGARSVIAERPADLLEVAVDDPPPIDVDTRIDYHRAVGATGSLR